MLFCIWCDFLCFLTQKQRTKFDRDTDNYISKTDKALPIELSKQSISFAQYKVIKIHTHQTYPYIPKMFTMIYCRHLL